MKDNTIKKESMRVLEFIILKVVEFFIKVNLVKVTFMVRVN